jgi:hypothetical protein
MWTAKCSLLKFHSFPIVLPSKMSNFGKCPKILSVVKWHRHLFNDSAMTEESFFCRLSQLIFITQHETNFLPISSTIRTATIFRNFRTLSQYCEKLLLASLRPSVRQHRIRLLLEGFSWNFIFEYFRMYVINFKVNYNLVIITYTLHEGAGIALSV